jgi:hypothetical protein
MFIKEEDIMSPPLNWEEIYALLIDVTSIELLRSRCKNPASFTSHYIHVFGFMRTFTSSIMISPTWLS